MKLATALSERSDVQRRLSELHIRLSHNAKVQEGDIPAEDPQALLREMTELYDRLQALIASINKTNSLTLSAKGSLTELLARRDRLRQELAMLRSFLNEASAKVDRYSAKEIKVISTVDVTELRTRHDAKAKELRELEELIQELNWTTELL